MNFTNPPRIDKVIAMVRVALFFDSRRIIKYHMVHEQISVKYHTFVTGRYNVDYYLSVGNVTVSLSFPTRNEISVINCEFYSYGTCS